MKVQWAILCQGSSIDNETKTLSLFNIVDELALPAEPPVLEGDDRPTIAAQMDLVVLWIRSEAPVAEVGVGNFQLLAPDGSKIAEIDDLAIELSEFLRYQLRLKLMGLPWAGEGDYRFLIRGGSSKSELKLLFELPLQINIKKP